MQLPERVQQIVNDFTIEVATLQRISDALIGEFELGLQQGRPASSVAMLPTFVPQLPDGTESGTYIAIDLSGKNLHIMLLRASAGRQADVVNNNFMIHDQVMKGTGDQLFNFIVNCLKKFLTDNGLTDSNLPIGFVFSYPCEMLSIRSARLLWWTKGFDINDCLQKDVVALLEEALDLNMTVSARVKAVMNDTVGQLAAAAHHYGPDCVMGVVVGYGCNASYLESTERITKFDRVAQNYSYPNMVVVTEWEEFGAKGELNSVLTSFDREIDANSVHKGKQIIDKLTGALYLGELVRVVLAQLVMDGVLFGGTPCEMLDTPNSFPSKYISEMLGDQDTTHRNCRRICDELEIPVHGSADYVILKEICYAVSKRSAAIAASAISALLKHMARSRVTIGVGGALIQFNPVYMTLLEDQLKALAPPNVQVPNLFLVSLPPLPNQKGAFQWKIVLAVEGSAKGAALIAAVVDKLGL